MKIHQIRNATLIIETEKCKILVDPMLGEKGTMPTLTLFRFKPQKNPIVSLPENTADLLKGITHCLLTHKHPDHLDKEGEKFLRAHEVPVICSRLDTKIFKKKGLNVVQEIDYWKKSDFLEGQLMGTPAVHGYGFIAKPMGNVMGFLLQLPGEPSVFLSSDTVYTPDVRKVLVEYQPDISVLASGSAQLDIGKPLLMHLDDIRSFVKDAPGKVVANHVEAVNHCPTSRSQLRVLVREEDLEEKVLIPEDGETISF